MRPLTKVADLVIGEFYAIGWGSKKCKLLEVKVERKSYSNYYPSTRNDGYRFLDEEGKELVAVRQQIGLQWDKHEQRVAVLQELYDASVERKNKAVSSFIGLFDTLACLGITLSGERGYRNDFAYKPDALSITGEEAAAISEVCNAHDTLKARLNEAVSLLHHAEATLSRCAGLGRGIPRPTQHEVMAEVETVRAFFSTLENGGA
jgi:hypothetical protein